MQSCIAVYIFVTTATVKEITVQAVEILDPNLPEDAILNTTGLATKYGHPPKEYEVVTDDGYILTLYRLPGGHHTPILLTHGLQDTSDTWLLRGYNSLAITLANDDQDVWLANSRGNKYSRRHKKLDPDKDTSYWSFSYHEMGVYDLPAIVDVILNETGAKNLTAIGHSQGTTMYFVFGSERSDYNAKINVMIALAPIAYLHHTPPPLSLLIKQYPSLRRIIHKIGIYELGNRNKGIRLLDDLCKSRIGYPLCAFGITFPFSGYDAAELEPDFYRISSAHFPAGGSSRNILHMLQVGYRKHFARYDFGLRINIKVYNSSGPPLYDLTKVTMPVALFAARNDHLSTLEDVAILRRQLPNVVYYIVNPRAKFNHNDAVWGRNMRVYLFPYIYNVLREYNHFS